MNRNEMILQSVNDYLMRRFECEPFPADFGTSHTTIYAREKQFSLYLRMVKESGELWDAGTLVIAQIGFYEERVGHGRDMLQFLSRIAAEHGFKAIGIESANERGAAFARKFVFHTIDDGTNYLITTDDLVEYFRSQTEL